MRIVIAARGYNPTKGGHIVLHKLCDSLLRMGLDVYMKPHSKHWAVNPNYLSQVTHEVTDDDFVIYHNSIEGNPFKAKRWIRWMLYRPAKIYDGFLVFYSEQFGPGPYLRVIEPHLDIFYNKGLERSGECWTWRKAQREGFKPEDRPKSGYEIPRGTDNHTLSNIFNNYKTFVSYDPATFLCVQSALCGCDTVAPKLVGNTFPYPGVARSMKDIPRAREEHGLLREVIEKEYREQDVNAAEVITKLIKEVK